MTDRLKDFLTEKENLEQKINNLIAELLISAESEKINISDVDIDAWLLRDGCDNVKKVNVKLNIKL